MKVYFGWQKFGINTGLLNKGSFGDSLRLVSSQGGDHKGRKYLIALLLCLGNIFANLYFSHMLLLLINCNFKQIHVS